MEATYIKCQWMFLYICIVYIFKHDPSYQHDCLVPFIVQNVGIFLVKTAKRHRCNTLGKKVWTLGGRYLMEF